MKERTVNLNPNAGPTVHRRAVLGMGVAAGTASFLAACGDESGTPQGGAGSSPATFSRADLPSGLRGKALLPGDAGYADEVKTYNLTVQHRPGVIIAAAAASDVQAAVRLAAEKGAAVAVLATGHQAIRSVEPGAVLVTTRAMRNVEVDPAKRTARVQAGALWQNVIDESVKSGLAPLAGSTPIVGVVGYTVGGGLSPMMGRAHGYAADHVRNFEIVTADGALRTVDAKTDPDLFFAVLGGKSNFGVVTAMEFGLFPVTKLFAGAMFFSGQDAKKVLEAYRKWVSTVPDAMSSSAALLRMPDVEAVPAPLRGQLVTTVRVSYLGSPATGARLIAPLRAAAKPLIDGVREIPFAAFPSVHADPVDPVPAIERTALLRELTPEAIDVLIAAAGPKAAFPLSMIEMRQLGGALGRQPATPNAVSNRDAAFTLFVAGVGRPTDAAAIAAAQEAVIKAVQPWATGQMFVNFMAAADVAPEAVRRAYQPQAYQRLAAIKRKVDPNNMFRLNHNIAPA
ncbi:FAD-binding protein [Actinoplanes sp. NPDC023936]|uniref:FAD-binding oxidoreductase n=1 Tax=Actinoplanes sp. NPDC023936 TaxID=3154910 RepID=UPI0033C95623